MINGKFDAGDIIKGLGAGICILDKNRRIVWVNDVLQKEWLGSKEDLRGKYCFEVFGDGNGLCEECPAIIVFKTGAIQVSSRARQFKQDVLKRHFQFTVSPIKDNQDKVVYALKLVQDVTGSVVNHNKHKKAIRSLKEMCSGLSSMNQRLHRNAQKLKKIVHSLSKVKSSINNKYVKKLNELAKMKQELRHIFKINCAINSTANLKKITALVTRLTCELMHIDGCLLRLFDEERRALVIRASYGINEKVVKGLPALRLGQNICGWIAKNRRPLAIYDLKSDRRIKNSELVTKEGFQSLLGVPIKLNNKILGVICTFSIRKRKFLEDEIELLSVFASQVAIAIQEAQYCEDLHSNYLDTIHALVLTIEARDAYTRGHTERVTKYALKIARAMRMSEAELEIVRYAGEMHDIGKISVPDSILSKPGKLTPEERAVIELHPEKGVDMIKPLDFLKPAIPIVRHHHERYDGTGYPDGLEKERIPLASRILACADAFDAMTSERPYRMQKLSTEEAICEIRNNSGSQFDPEIADIFIKTIIS